jgi:hypothetical protein
VYLFGGITIDRNNGARDLNDTWMWDGNDWSQLEVSTAPPKSGTSWTWIPSSKQLLMSGGDDGDWIWDGVEWQQTTTFPASAGGFAFFDTIRGEVVTAVAKRPSGGSIETWARRIGSGAERCLSSDDEDHDGRGGCSDPDCWGRCTPLCSPYTATDALTQTSVAWPASCAIAFPDAPRCGDAVCNVDLEDRFLCPQDCP